MAFVLIVRVQAVAALGGAGRGGVAPSAAPAGRSVTAGGHDGALLLSYPISMSCCNFYCDLIFFFQTEASEVSQQKEESTTCPDRYVSGVWHCNGEAQPA